MANEHEHAKFSPSTLRRTILCNGSWKEMQERPETPQSEFAKRGSLLHEYVHKAYTEGKHVVSEIENITDRYQVLECLEYLETLSFSFHSVYDIALEEKVYLEKLDPSFKDVWGTADVVIYDPHTATLYVIDWKFGKGVKEFAFENPQGLAYLAGSLVKFPKTVNLEFHIFQPSLDHVDVYKTTVPGISKFLEEQLKPAIKGALSDNPTYSPSVTACKFCVAKIDCPYRHKANVEAAQEVFKMYSNLPKVKPEELRTFLDTADELKSYIKAIQDHIRDSLRKGDPIPGYKLVYGRANRTWADKKAAVKWLLENTNLTEKEIFKSEFRGPAAIEKADKTLKNDEEFAALVIKPEGKITIAKDADTRQEVTPSTEAVKAFAEYK